MYLAVIPSRQTCCFLVSPDRPGDRSLLRDLPIHSGEPGEPMAQQSLRCYALSRWLDGCHNATLSTAMLNRSVARCERCLRRMPAPSVIGSHGRG
jgi:hypothetical protein